MKKFFLSGVALIASGMMASAADMGQPYTKAPPMVTVTNWTGFYVGGGGGYNIWNGDSKSNPDGDINFLGVTSGGHGYFGTVSGGYDWQLSRSWVVGLFADAQFGDMKGSFLDRATANIATVNNDLNYAVGGRFGYLISPDMLMYLNGGYSHAEFKGGPLRNEANTFISDTKYDGWFVGFGTEYSIHNLFGISLPGWFLKSEYRFAEYNAKGVPVYSGGGPVFGTDGTFKPYQQTVSTQLVYRFNSVSSVPQPAVAPTAPSNWTGFYVGGGGGYGMLAADQVNFTNAGVPSARGSYQSGARGGFGTVSGGYDWQVTPGWVVGIMADAQFGDINGAMLQLDFVENGQIKNNMNYAVGGRVGYLVTPNVLSYFNGGYSHADFKGFDYVSSTTGISNGLSSPNYSGDGYFIGGGIENSISLFGISAPGWFLKTEYRYAEYDNVSTPVIPASAGSVSLKPRIQTVSGQLIYRFNSGQ